MSLIKHLCLAVGENHVETQPQSLTGYLLDNRKRIHGEALCCVHPANTEEVAECVRIARAHQVQILVQGGNTSNVGAATPVATDFSPTGCMLMRLDRMRAIGPIDPIGRTVHVQAGCTIETLQKVASEHNLLFAMKFGAQGSASIGGMLATNAGGVHVLAYGNTRSQCLGLKVVLASGEILDLSSTLFKDNTGYDLRDLFIGSEGTLGIITEADFRLFVQPHARTVAFVALPHLAASNTVFAKVREQLDPVLTAFELMHVDTLKRVKQVFPDLIGSLQLDAPWYCLIELSAPSSVWAELMEKECLDILEVLSLDEQITDAIISQNEQHAQRLWRIREDLPEAYKATGGNVKHDISVPVGSVTAFIEMTEQALRVKFPWIELSVFGHFGDGNLHYNVGTASGFDRSLAFDHEEEIHAVVYECVAHFSGSIAAEHGIGRLKRDLLKSTKSAVHHRLLQALKNMLDPEQRLNPGAVLAPHSQEHLE